MRALARGLLDDEAGLCAEGLRSSCPHCAGWWRSTFDCEALAAVDEAVGEAFARFAAPARPKRWTVAAAAALLVLAVGGTALLWDRGGPVGDPTPQPQVVTLDFESGDLSGLQVVGSDRSVGDAAPAAGAVFESGLEDGDLSGWTTSS